MRVLALDTTTPAGSCALLSGGAVLREQASDARAPAERLPSELMALVEQSGVTLGEVDVFAVATGPGSFTGLRIGIATMQGLSFAAGKPLVGVSGLDALARIGEADAEGACVATWVDAWRGEIYAALYRHGREIEPPVVATPEQVLARIAGSPTLFIGDGALKYVDAIRARLGRQARVASPIVPLLSGAIAVLADAAVASGIRPAPEAIRPLYVRRTDAEIARDARAAG